MLVKLTGTTRQCGVNEAGMNPKLFDEINEKMKAVLAQGPAADIEKNMRALLAGLFSRLDLVTREEFDVQREVLVRTRAKLAELEKKVAALEADTVRAPVSR
jgi:BMFP domain-containing protein YqiC